MPYLLVAPLSRIAEVSVTHRAREMISILGANHAFHRPATIAPGRHLQVDFNDITNEVPGLVAPQVEHVERIIAFAQGWNRGTPLLVHCWMGISRSPAAALVIALALAPDQDEADLAHRLRAASPFSTPNARMVAIGDALLGRSGRLERAVHAIGRGADTMEGLPFSMALRPDEASPLARHRGLRHGGQGR